MKKNLITHIRGGPLKKMTTYNYFYFSKTIN